MPAVLQTEKLCKSFGALTVAQSIDYPVQLMLDVYEFPPESAGRDAAALPHRFRVAHVRTYPGRP